MSRDSLTRADGHALRRRRGQTLAELGIVMPLLMFLFLGIFQIAFLIHQQYDAIHLAREAANLIARDDNLDTAVDAMTAAQLGRKFETDVSLILSVLQLGPAGTPNAGVPIIMHRLVAGGLTGVKSVLGDPGADRYESPDSKPPDHTYKAKESGTDPKIHALLPLPNKLDLTIGPNQLVYVAEIYVKRRDIVPLSKTAAPLYAVAYF